MNPLLATLIVTVAAGGGPHSAQGELLTNGLVRVTRNKVVVARADDGHLKRRLRPGSYHVEALLAAEEGKPAKLCEAATVHLERGRTTRVKLYCSIK